MHVDVGLRRERAAALHVEQAKDAAAHDVVAHPALPAGVVHGGNHVQERGVRVEIDRGERRQFFDVAQKQVHGVSEAWFEDDEGP